MHDGLDFFPATDTDHFRSSLGKVAPGAGRSRRRRERDRRRRRLFPDLDGYAHLERVSVRT